MRQTKEEKLEYAKKYYRANKEKISERIKNYKLSNIEKFRSYQKSYRIKNREKYLPYYQEKRNKFRKELLKLAGGIECKSCGFQDWRALQIDHINGNGRKDDSIRKNQVKFKRDVIENPNKYQVLCANCNWIKRYENNECNSIYGAIDK